jgi:hypothetical protein
MPGKIQGENALNNVIDTVLRICNHLHQVEVSRNIQQGEGRDGMEKRGKLIQCLVCIAVFALATTTTSMANLLTDPGAENATTAPNPNPTSIPGWSFFNGAAFSSAFAHSGTNSLGDVGGGGFQVPGDYQQFAATAGQQFTMTGFALTPTAIAGGANFGQLQITFFSGPNGTGSDIGTVETGGVGAKASAQVNSTSPVGVWIPLSVTATAPAGAQSMQAFTIVIDQNATAVYFDDLTLDLIPEPSTIAMTLTGLLGLVAFGWKKRRV